MNVDFHVEEVGAGVYTVTIKVITVEALAKLLAFILKIKGKS